MCIMPSCLVDRSCKVYAKNGVHSHTDLAIKFGIEEDKCLRYEFKLETRTLFQDFAMDHAPFPAKASHDAAAQAWFDRSVGTPEKLIAFVKKGNFDEDVLAALLSETGYESYTKAMDTHDRAHTKAYAVAQKIQ